MCCFPLQVLSEDRDSGTESDDEHTYDDAEPGKGIDNFIIYKSLINFRTSKFVNDLSCTSPTPFDRLTDVCIVDHVNIYRIQGVSSRVRYPAGAA